MQNITNDVLNLLFYKNIIIVNSRDRVVITKKLCQKNLMPTHSINIFAFISKLKDIISITLSNHNLELKMCLQMVYNRKHRIKILFIQLKIMLKCVTIHSENNNIFIRNIIQFYSKLTSLRML
jgi:hypothetical protein